MSCIKVKSFLMILPAGEYDWQTLDIKHYLTFEASAGRRSTLTAYCNSNACGAAHVGANGEVSLVEKWNKEGVKVVSEVG